MATNARIKDLLPAHYREYAPRFIVFLDKYYEWLYRSSGMSADEINDLKSNTSWLEKDIDRFIATGQIRYIDPASTSGVLADTLVVLNNVANPGDISGSLTDKFMLDENFNGYLTSDGVPFSDANDISVELDTVENQVLDSWFTSMGLDRIKRRRLNALSAIDQVLMLSLLKHIYAIKGTEASIKLFFHLFFNENITIYQPKINIANIDNNWVLEGNQVIRDDVAYQEYSYVILVSNAISTYSDIFNAIYIKTIHPSGFRVILMKASDFAAGMRL